MPYSHPGESSYRVRRSYPCMQLKLITRSTLQRIQLLPRIDSEAPEDLGQY